MASDREFMFGIGRFFSPIGFQSNDRTSSSLRPHLHPPDLDPAAPPHVPSARSPVATIPGSQRFRARLATLPLPLLPSCCNTLAMPLTPHPPLFFSGASRTPCTQNRQPLTPPPAMPLSCRHRLRVDSDSASPTSPSRVVARRGDPVSTLGLRLPFSPESADAKSVFS